MAVVWTHPDPPLRKPNPGMILQALAEWPIDRESSLLVGDKASDVQAGQAAGVARPRGARRAALRPPRRDRPVAARAGAAAHGGSARVAAGTPLSPIDGVPTGIKDLILTRGMPTLRGSKTVDQSQSWADDAPAAARLKEAGADVEAVLWSGIFVPAATPPVPDPRPPSRICAPSSNSSPMAAQSSSASSGITPMAAITARAMGRS